MENKTLEKLRLNGERITPIRSSLITLLTKSTVPLTPQEILTALAKKGFKANKTTVYRQLESLVEFNLVRSVSFDDRTKHYELVSDHGHHHHLICLKCKRVEDITFPADLKLQEKNILSKHKFKVLRHSLEFFGLCKNCKK